VKWSPSQETDCQILRHMEHRKKSRSKNFAKGNLTKGDNDMRSRFLKENSSSDFLRSEFRERWFENGRGKMKGCECLTKNPLYFSFLAVLHFF